MKHVLLAVATVSLLTGCGSFSFRPAMLLVCTSACEAKLYPPAPTASAPVGETP
jgi:hypothetical protein